MPPAAEYFIGTVGGELVSHLAVAPRFNTGGYRATRLVVMPEWQGAGVGTKFLNWVCEYHKRGYGRCGHRLPTYFHTSHPQLIGYLKHSREWILKSQNMVGANKARSVRTLRKSGSQITSGFGGHFRAVQGFKYVGDRKPPKDGIPD